MSSFFSFLIMNYNVKGSAFYINGASGMEKGVSGGIVDLRRGDMLKLIHENCGL